MPRRSNFKYQIDRRRSKKNQEMDDEEEAYIFGDDDDNDNDQGRAAKKNDNRGSGSDGDYSEEENKNENDDDGDDEVSDGSHGGHNSARSITTTKKAHSRQRKRPPSRKKKSTSDDESEFVEDLLDGEEEEEDDEEQENTTKPGKMAKSVSSRKRNSDANANAGQRGRQEPSPNPLSEDEEDKASSSGQEWPEEKDDLDDEDFVPEVASKPAVRKSKRGAPSDSSSEDENLQVDDDDDEDSEEYKAVNPRKKRNGNKPRRPPAKKQRRKQAQELEDEESEEADFDIDEDDEKVIGGSKRSTRRRGRARPQKNGRQRTPKYSSGYADNDDDEIEPGAPPTRPTRSRRAASTFGRKSYKEVASDEEEEEEENDEKEEEDDSNENYASSTSRPRRSSAFRASQKWRELGNEENDDDDKEDDGNEVKSTKNAVSPSKLPSSDEEFLADSVSEDSNDKEVFYTDSEDDDEATSQPASKPKAVDIDNEEIGSADDSDGEGGNDDSLTKHSTKDTPDTPSTGQLDDIQPSQHKGSQSKDDDSDHHGASRLFNSPPKLPECQSLEDAVTMEPLPKIHVCHISPDGCSRQCFAIETLRQISLKSARLPFRTDVDGSQQDTFLQPPHFRTAMNDDLLDQIASRFGRDALDLHGQFYQRKPQDLRLHGLMDVVDDEDEDYDFEAIFGPGAQYFGEEFVERVQKYMSSQMGSKDVYACPLCYSEIHRRLVHSDRNPGGSQRGYSDDAHDERAADDDSTEDEKFLTLPADSTYDPMMVLGWLDNEKFEVASCFCFVKVAYLKKHLREDHHVQTKGIQGNDLYQRYRVRSQDGLLQRYLHSQWSRVQGTTFQGAMQRYWFEGNNQSFVYLLHMMRQAEIFADILSQDDFDDEDKEKAEQFFEVGKTFFQSIHNRAQLEWDQISSPFTKSAEKDDLRDFLAHDGDEEDDNQEETPYFLTHRHLMQEDAEESDPNDLISRLQRKYAENERNDFGEVQDDIGDQAVEDEEQDLSVTSDLNRNGYYSEEEEEKDEWMTNIQNKRRLKRSTPQGKPRAPPKANSVTPKGRKLTRRNTSTPGSSVAVVSVPTSASSKRRSIAVESSSDEEEFVDG